MPPNDWRPVVVRVFRPTDAEGPLGQKQGTDEKIYGDSPAKMRTLNGREIVQARTVFAEAQHEIQFNADPSKPIAERDYFELVGTTAVNGKQRRLNVVFKNDHFQNGTKLTLLCGERTGG